MKFAIVLAHVSPIFITFLHFCTTMPPHHPRVTYNYAHVAFDTGRRCWSAGASRAFLDLVLHE